MQLVPERWKPEGRWCAHFVNFQCTLPPAERLVSTPRSTSWGGEGQWGRRLVRESPRWGWWPQAGQRGSTWPRPESIPGPHPCSPTPAPLPEPREAGWRGEPGGREGGRRRRPAGPLTSSWVPARRRPEGAREQDAAGSRLQHECAGRHSPYLSGPGVSQRRGPCRAAGGAGGRARGHGLPARRPGCSSAMALFTGHIFLFPPFLPCAFWLQKSAVAVEKHRLFPFLSNFLFASNFKFTETRQE